MGLEKTVFYTRESTSNLNDAPRVGFEPTTLRLTGEHSTTELPGIVNELCYYNKPSFDNLLNHQQ